MVENTDRAPVLGDHYATAGVSGFSEVKKGRGDSTLIGTWRW